MSRKIHFNLHAKLPVLIKKDDGWYVASCPILDVVTQGKTEKSAMKNIKEALSLFFISCLERGTLDQVLKNCGAKADIFLTASVDTGTAIVSGGFTLLLVDD